MSRIIRSITKTKLTCNANLMSNPISSEGRQRRARGQVQLASEIVDALPNVSSVNLLPVVEGFSLTSSFPT